MLHGATNGRNQANSDIIYRLIMLTSLSPESGASQVSKRLILFLESSLLTASFPKFMSRAQPW